MWKYKLFEFDLGRTNVNSFQQCIFFTLYFFIYSFFILTVPLGQYNLSCVIFKNANRQKDTYRLASKKGKSNIYV